MARGFEELFHVDGGVPESHAGFLARHADGREERGLRAHDAHAAAAAAARSLDDDRVADPAGDLDDLLGIIGERAVGAWNAGDARFPHGLLGAHLVAHEADGFCARTDEGKA